MDVLNFAASICSIAGAIVAWWQYRKAKNASQAAVEAKNFILDRKNTIDLNELLKEARLIETMVIGYAIKNETSTKGRNKSKDLKFVQFFLSKLNETKAHIEDTSAIKCKLDERYNRIDEFSKGLNDDKEDLIKKLLDEIRALVSILSAETNRNFYQ